MNKEKTMPKIYEIKTAIAETGPNFYTNIQFKTLVDDIYSLQIQFCTSDTMTTTSDKLIYSMNTQSTPNYKAPTFSWKT